MPSAAFCVLPLSPTLRIPLHLHSARTGQPQSSRGTSTCHRRRPMQQNQSGFDRLVEATCLSRLPSSNVRMLLTLPSTCLSLTSHGDRRRGAPMHRFPTRAAMSNSITMSRSSRLPTHLLSTTLRHLSDIMTL
ncbi:hypothetical protein OH77DRAFT_1230805 [Trametes cingulata]|nr:hypothetical protein OH77DRAFT_1230805 [Trametes cingulata]